MSVKPNNLRMLVIGLGVQGRKRLAVASDEVVGTVDPVNPEADFQTLDDVKFDSFDAALLCTPDGVKTPLLERLLSAGKHVLVEKPLLADMEEFANLRAIIRKTGATCYTAYNHRFEPHVQRLKALLDDESMGRVYTARFFYGNGTARDVYNSAWRDQGSGVLSDLGSHLLDLSAYFFEDQVTDFVPWAGHRFENRAFDHVIFGGGTTPAVHMEVSLLSWRNEFTIDLLCEKGSVHLRSLRKWGPCSFITRRRKFPSGKPDEEEVVLVEPDDTWSREYSHFKRMCANGGHSLEKDVWISATLRGLAVAMEVKGDK